MTQSLFQRAQGLVELIASEPLRAQVISYLSREIAPSGEVAGVAFAQLSRDGMIHIVAQDGFADFDSDDLPDFNINSRRAASVALRAARMTFFTESELESFQKYLPENLKGHWKSAVAIPIGLQAIYFINFRDDVTLYRDFEDFLHCISSILTSFEWTEQTRSGRHRDLWFSEEKHSLSIREDQILELIRMGWTNQQIATKLCFSESLIRQETVAIYRKLGVTGRKEIMNQETTPKRATKNAIRVAIALAGIETLAPLFSILHFNPQVIL